VVDEVSWRNSEMKKLIIVGSARNDGNAMHLAQQLKEKAGWHIIDLNEYSFSYYDYKHENQGDDFLPLMRKIISNYGVLIFVTPVYWYTMSGVMKVFFDRFTDLLTIEKDLGRRLRGKHMAAVSCSAGGNLGDSFWLPFLETANYLGIKYLGNMHTTTGENNQSKITKFVESIEN
jgi:multimeric flavodoxin WrbA